MPLTPPPDRLVRRWTIGDALLEGPRHLFLDDPPAGQGWLECQLQVRWQSGDFRACRSTLIFCDEDGNEESGFLPPVVRVFAWDRRADRMMHPWWPKASLEVRRLVEPESLQPFVTQLQAAVLALALAPCGLNTRRNYPAWDASEGQLHLAMELGLQTHESRCQHVEIALPVACARPLWAAAQALESAAQHGSVVVPRGRFREEYELNLDKCYPLERWEWDGTIPEP